MTDTFSVAAQVLEQWGATVTSIPASHKNESDWLAQFGTYRLLVEEKTKIEEPEATAARAKTLARGEVHGSTLPLGYNNRLSGIVRKAAKQLSSTGQDVAHDGRVVWFTGTGFDAEAKHYQFIGTLYGSTKIFQLNHPGMKECYFFRNADFFRFGKQLDGAVVAFLHGNTVTVKLCLNPYSERWESLRDSPFASHFELGLIDPVAEEAAGEAYIADTDQPRSDLDAVIRYLEVKYGLEHAHNMDMNMASAVVAAPR
ncbi:MAG: hypothetical protein V4624_10475 [Pseudomonadota bacterium]